MNETDLENYDCIYFCDVGQFGVNEHSQVDGHLRAAAGSSSRSATRRRRRIESR